MSRGSQMRITAIHIQHYKSLADVQIELSPVTVLVGPNGSGKSNVVDALRFLREAIVHGLDHAISERGGIDISRQYSPTRPYTISMDIKFEYSSLVADQVYPGHYAFKVSGSGGNHHVESEKLLGSMKVVTSTKIGMIGLSIPFLKIL